MSHGPRGFFRDDEKSQKREMSSKQLWKWMFSYIKEFKVIFIPLSGLLFTFSIINAFLPYMNQLIIDQINFNGNTNITEIWNIAQLLIFQYGTFLMISNIGSGFVHYYLGKIGTNIVYKIRNDIFNNIQHMSMDYFDKSHSGDIISVATNDVDQLNMIFSGMIVQLIAEMFKAILVIILMLYINWELALLSFIMIPIMMIGGGLFTKRAKKAFKKTRKEISNVTQVAEQNISGMKVIQSYGKQDEAEKEFDDANKANRAAMMEVRKIMSFLFPVIMMIMSLFTILILFYGGSAFLNNNTTPFGNVLTIGALTAFNSYLMQLFFPVMAIAMFQQFGQSALAAAERIYKLIYEESEIPDPKIPENFTHVNGNIEFNNVRFSYSERETKEDKSKEKATKKSRIQKRREKIKAKRLSRQNKIEMKSGEKPHMSQMSEMPKIPPEAMKRFMEMPDSEMKQKMMARYKEMHGKMAPGDKISGREGHDGAPPGSMGMFGEMMKDPENILKMARALDKKLKGANGAGLSSGGSGGGMSGGGSMGGGMGGSRKMDMSQIPTDMLFMILGSDKIPPEIYEQFSPTVKTAIKEDKEIRAHKTGTIIKNISFNIPAGKTIAFVGPTGAGKTTIVKLLSRFYDIEEDKGQITIDGINIKEVNKVDLRSVIGMVPQDSFLFTGTILENLYYGKPKDEPIVLDEKLLEISKFLGLHNFIDNMPEKYDTYLLENAANLSVGQRQLICFARVLMTDPKILILDEATSSVDPYTESLIQDALEKAKEGRTTIIIAHRLSTIKNADEIFVVDEGKIIEHGSHNDLIAANGHYANLVAMQAKDA